MAHKHKIPDRLQDLGITDERGRSFRGDDFVVSGIHRHMELAPGAPSPCTVPAPVPFILAMDLQAGGVDDPMARRLTHAPPNLDRQRRRPAAERTVIRDR